MLRSAQALFWCGFLFLSVSATAQDSREYIVAARRMGVIELIDPATLDTRSTITVSVPPDSTGLNGVLATPDGRTIYVEGPIGPNSPGANNCCWLYSINLETLEARIVAGIWGTRGSDGLIGAGPGRVLRTDAAANATVSSKGDYWQSSPDRAWWFGLRRGAILDLYDAVKAQIVRSFDLGDKDEQWNASGIWLGNRFYLYGTHKGSAGLWIISPESTQLSEYTLISEPAQVAGCKFDALTDILGAGEHLFVYEVFGAKLDRRECGDAGGGIWMLEPENGAVVMQIAPDMHFWKLVPNQAGTELYGITSEGTTAQGPARLVRIDSRNGNVLQSRFLDSDFWWITAISLRDLPSRNATAMLPAGKSDLNAVR